MRFSRASFADFQTPSASAHGTVEKSYPAILSAIGISVLLGACASSPLPPWTPGTQPTVPAATTAPAASPVSPPAPAQAVQVTPIPSADLPPTSVGEAPAPYNAAVAARFPDPLTRYATPGLEPGRNDFTTTGEINTWLRTQAGAAGRTPGTRASVIIIGRSQEGQAIDAMVIAKANSTDPATLLSNGRPTALLVGQQHGDEPAGSEALLVVARDLAQGRLAPLLERINVVIVPRANPDGATRTQRVTQGGIDMNRDHLLLTTPEAQALARVTRDYRPMVVVDSHEYTAVGRFQQKFNALQRYDALLQYATTANLPEFLTKASEEWYRKPLLAALKTQGLTNEWYYTTSTDIEDKKVSMGGVQPDTSRNVNGLKNAVSFLIETRGVGLGRLHIQRRVHTHVTALGSVLASTAQRAAELNQLRPYIEKETAALACRQEAVIEAAATPAQYDLMMLDPVTGADKTVSVDWDSALSLRKLKTRVRPCGYWLSAAANTAVERLRLHGVQVMRAAEPGSVLGDTFRETSRSTGERADVRGTIAGPAPVIRAQVSLVRGVVDIPRNSYYVPLNQPLANLALAALEPDTQSSFFANQVLPDLQSAVRVLAEPAFRLEAVP
jgi:hypothetical protein